jgi:hypothetical protein
MPYRDFFLLFMFTEGRSAFLLIRLSMKCVTDSEHVISLIPYPVGEGILL